jgi:predicted dehydrogenase
MKPVRIGAIGSGWWATSNHFPLLQGRDDVELVGVSGLGEDLENIRDRFGFTFSTHDSQEILAADIDAVVISTPHDLHHQYAAEALERGLHVMCEKPMTLYATDAWDLVERQRRAGTHFLVPYGWNYKPFTQQAKAFLDAEAIGEIQYALCHMASPTRGLFAGDPTHVMELWTSGTAPSPDTWAARERGGGYANGQMTHSTALLFWLTGLRAESVAAHAQLGPRDVDLFDSGWVRFDGGASGALSGAATLADGDDYQVDIRLFGTDGVLMLDTERERVRLHRYGEEAIEIPIPVGEGGYECTVPPIRFIELINGKSSQNNSTVEVAAKSVELIEAMLKSAEQGGTPVSVHQ